MTFTPFVTCQLLEVPVSKARDAIGLVLATVRARLASGEIEAGRVLSSGELANELRVSTTPVREALMRLTGEGRLVLTRGSGFMRPKISAPLLRDLYRLHEAQLAWALQLSMTSGYGAGQALTWEAEPALEPLFAGVIARADNLALAASHAAVAAQLEPARRHEPVILTNVQQERDALSAAAAAGDWTLWTQLSAAYHARRWAAAAQLSQSLEGANDKGASMGKPIYSDMAWDESIERRSLQHRDVAIF